jgi:hypothetical protein
VLVWFGLFGSAQREGILLCFEIETKIESGLFLHDRCSVRLT